jgi:nucleoside-diphosphate-sugar epimerase
VGDVYNVGSGHAVSIAEVLNKAVSLSRSTSKLIPKTNTQLFFKENALSNMICADVTKLSALGFKPHLRLDATLNDVLEFWRNRV